MRGLFYARVKYPYIHAWYYERMNGVGEHRKRVLYLTLGELAFAVVALPLYIFLVLPKHEGEGLVGILPAIPPDVNPVLAIVAAIGVLAASIAVLLVMVRRFGSVQFVTGEMLDLIREFSLLDLVPIYLAAGFSEEYLFRVVGIDLCGLLLASILFVAVHIAYWKKPLLLVEVFIMALLMGVLYLFTRSLLLCALAHFAYNMIVSWLLVSGRVSIEPPRANPE